MASKKWVVVATRIPTNSNNDTAYVVEAATAEDAREIVRERLGDRQIALAGGLCNYRVSVGVPYTPPPAGGIVETL